MPRATVDGLSISYEVIGEGRPWTITPGGRFSKDDPGVREFAEALARDGNRVLIWDRPNCGESDVCFTGSSEPAVLAQDRQDLVSTLERWIWARCPCGDDLVPGLPDADARALDIPALVFRSGESDAFHTRATSEAVAASLPRARLVEPPWGDREWIERGTAREQTGGLFVRWPLLAP